MNSNKEKVGLFLTDASFDYKSKVSSIAILDLKTNQKFNKQEIVSGPKEGESKGIIEALKKGIKLYKNIIVFCDNIHSVNEVRREVLGSKFWKAKYYYIQIVWVPREETHLADFFSKNLDSSEENLNLKIESFKNKCTNNNVMDIIISSEDKINVLKEFLKDSLKENSLIKDFKFQSNILKDIFYTNKFNLNDIEKEGDKIKEDYLALYKEFPSSFNSNSPLKKLFEGLFTF